ncbi:MAG TPA: hypothetical protein VFE86_16850 [Ilumatobacteraceae bacterium]|nr:hypothetical protein [Ilumatobacteraceae bacterium]
MRNHALVDGNKRLGLAAVIAFYGLNGHCLRMTNGAAYDFVIAVVGGELDDVTEIARRSRASSPLFMPHRTGKTGGAGPELDRVMRQSPARVPR